MRVLVVGGGGREHALVWKIRQSPDVKEVYCAPGNPGIAELADCIPIASSDIVELADFAEKLRMTLTVVGPELPLTLGIVDEFEKRGMTIFGPNRLAAEIEGSKVFAKELFRKYGIPTGKSEVVRDTKGGMAAAAGLGFPVVVKADGLAGGKGVVIAESKADLEKTLSSFFEDNALGKAAERVLIEEFLTGEEVSIIVLTDGRTIVPMAAAKDYKKIFDDDRGPNTGGMGAHSPAVVVTGEMQGRILREIVYPTVKAMETEGRPFKGALYAGVILTEDGPKVLEYNCRFGDPETQPTMLRLDSDIVPFLLKAAQGNLDDAKLAWKKEAAVSVALVSKGYPGFFEKGKLIEGIDAIRPEDDVVLFHAGTAQTEAGLVTNGGRVFNVSARGATLTEACERAYRAAEVIRYDGKFFRRDIGYRALARMKPTG
jgi:phosphoribosylamine--glycine ligase